MTKVGACLSAVLFIFCATPGFADIAGVATRVSENANQIGGNAASGSSSISPSGKLLVFQSGASNLVGQDTNGAIDIFAYNLDKKKILRASVGRKKVQADGPSSDPQVSSQTPNGAYVIAFASDATNLGKKPKIVDNNSFSDIYATLFPQRITIRVTRGADGDLPNGPSISPGVTLLAEPNRLFFVYSSRANNLTTDDQNNFSDIYLSKFTAPTKLDDGTDVERLVTTTRISRSAAAGVETDDDCVAPRISGNADFIVFESQASNLVAGTVTSGRQIYLYSVKTGVTSLISKAADGTPGNANSRRPVINYSGSYVVYISAATNIVSDGITIDPMTYQVIRYDTTTGLSERVNVTPGGVAGNGHAFDLGADMDASGRFVFFSDRADNLIGSDTNGFADVFVKDMGTGAIERVSKSLTGGDADFPSVFPSVNRTDFTALTGIAAFTSAATNVVANDTEGSIDLFSVPLTFTPLPLSNATRLEVPPSVTIDSDSARMNFESFSSGVAPALSNSAGGEFFERADTTSRIQYRLTYYREDSNGRAVDRTRLISRRNKVSVRSLRPGTYVSSYRAQVTQGGTVVSSTPSSPRQRFTIF